MTAPCATTTTSDDAAELPDFGVYAAINDFAADSVAHQSPADVAAWEVLRL